MKNASEENKVINLFQVWYFKDKQNTQTDEQPDKQNKTKTKFQFKKKKQQLKSQINKSKQYRQHEKKRNAE